MLKIGNGKNTYWVIAQITNIGINRIELMLTENKEFAKSQQKICMIKADSMDEARCNIVVKDFITERYYN
jgi:hypothetical protein